MENLFEKEEEEQQQDNESEIIKEEGKDLKWGINYENEKNFWDKVVLKDLIYVGTICPKCNKNTYRIYEKKTVNDIISPYYIDSKCQKKENISNIRY